MRCDAWIIAVLSGQKTRLGRGRRRATRRDGARSHERVRPAEMAPPQGVASRNGKPGATRGRKASGLLGDSGASERGPVYVVGVLSGSASRRRSRRRDPISGLCQSGAVRHIRGVLIGLFRLLSFSASPSARSRVITCSSRQRLQTLTGALSPAHCVPL
jgi:hypothetical protein